MMRRGLDPLAHLLFNLRHVTAHSLLISITQGVESVHNPQCSQSCERPISAYEDDLIRSSLRLLAASCYDSIRTWLRRERLVESLRPPEAVHGSHSVSPSGSCVSVGIERAHAGRIRQGGRDSSPVRRWQGALPAIRAGEVREGEPLFPVHLDNLCTSAVSAAICSCRATTSEGRCLVVPFPFMASLFLTSETPSTP